MQLRARFFSASRIVETKSDQVPLSADRSNKSPKGLKRSVCFVHLLDIVCNKLLSHSQTAAELRLVCVFWTAPLSGVPTWENRRGIFALISRSVIFWWSLVPNVSEAAEATGTETCPFEQKCPSKDCLCFLYTREANRRGSHQNTGCLLQAEKLLLLTSNYCQGQPL